MKRSSIHSLFIAVLVLLIGFNTAFQVPARSLHLVHAHHHCPHVGCPDLPGRLPRSHLAADTACSICDAFDLFHTVFYSNPLYFPGYFTSAAGLVPGHVPAFIQNFYLFCSARAPPGLIFPDQTG